MSTTPADVGAEILDTAARLAALVPVYGSAIVAGLKLLRSLVFDHHATAAEIERIDPATALGPRAVSDAHLERLAEDHDR